MLSCAIMKTGFSSWGHWRTFLLRSGDRKAKIKGCKRQSCTIEIWRYSCRLHCSFPLDLTGVASRFEGGKLPFIWRQSQRKVAVALAKTDYWTFCQNLTAFWIFCPSIVLEIAKQTSLTEINDWDHNKACQHCMSINSAASGSRSSRSWRWGWGCEWGSGSDAINFIRRLLTIINYCVKAYKISKGSSCRYLVCISVFFFFSFWNLRSHWTCFCI